MRRTGWDNSLHDVFCFVCRPEKSGARAYEIYVYTDGSAQIKLDSINQVIQTHEDITAGDMNLKAGTIILPGNGNEVYYEYPRHDKVLN